MPKRLIVAITGASGAVYGVRLLQVLRDLPEVETHLVISPAGAATLRQELGMEPAELKALASVEPRLPGDRRDHRQRLLCHRRDGDRALLHEHAGRHRPWPGRQSHHPRR